MNLTRERLLTYQGLNDFDGLCHVRIYEQPGQLPIVIAGALDDNPGTSITNAISMVASAVQRSEFSDGREFRLIEHYPDTIDGRGTPTYALVQTIPTIMRARSSSSGKSSTRRSQRSAAHRSRATSATHAGNPSSVSTSSSAVRSPSGSQAAIQLALWPASRASGCAVSWPRTPTARATRSWRQSGRASKGATGAGAARSS
jgi:hypothetical protein